MSKSYKIPNGIITLIETDFNCPLCGELHTEKDYEKKMKLSKTGVVHLKCNNCNEVLGVTFCMTGDIKVWTKDDENQTNRILKSKK